MKHDRHLKILYRGLRLGSLDFYRLYRQCLERSRTPVAPATWYRRAQSALHLARYFLASLEVDGRRAECGVFRGFTALLMCRLARDRDPSFRGDDLIFLDSFEGLSQPTAEDVVEVRDSGGGSQRVLTHAAGHFATPLEHVRHVLRKYPDARLLKGWIPGVFSDLPEGPWSFVHVDVDLYEPALASLEYFYPRMAKGGIMVNDDYGSASFPGSGKAWRRFCGAHGIPFATLDTGQAVLIRE